MNWLQRIAVTDIGFVDDPSGQRFWGNQGSGCLFVRDHPIEGFQMLAVLRSHDVEQPNTWGTTGGALPEGEIDAFQSALRETEEEIGSIPPFEKIYEWTYKVPNGNFTFTNYVLKVLDPTWEPGPFNWEVTDAQWIPINQAHNLDLHFGLEELLQQPELQESFYPNDDPNPRNIV